MNLGSLYMAAGASEQAITRYRSAVEADPSRVRAYDYLAVALLQVGDSAEARKALPRALDFAPSHAEARELRDRITLDNPNLR